VATLVAVPSNGSEPAPAVHALIRARGLMVDEIVVEAGRLDDVFRDLTTRPS
jgi:hypothetical protein